MQWQDINEFFDEDKPIHVPKEAATCFVCYHLYHKGESYAQEIEQDISQANPRFRVSSTSLNEALKFLRGRGIITYKQVTTSTAKSNTQRFFRLTSKANQEAHALKKLWLAYQADPYA